MKFEYITKRSQELLDALWVNGDRPEEINEDYTCDEVSNYIRKTYGLHIHVYVSGTGFLGDNMWVWEITDLNCASRSEFCRTHEAEYIDAFRVAIEHALEWITEDKIKREAARRHQEMIKRGECITRKEAEGIMEKALEAAKMQGIDGATYEYVMRECKELLYYTTE